MQFYHSDTVDILYKVQVDNVIYIVVHNDNCQNWMLHKIATSVLYYFDQSDVIDAL